MILTLILIAIIILLAIGLGWDAFMEALKKGYDTIPADKVVDNFKDAAIESAKDIQEEMEQPSIDDLKVEEETFKDLLDGLKVNFKP